MTDRTTELAHEVIAESVLPTNYLDLDKGTRRIVEWNARQAGLDPQAFYSAALAARAEAEATQARVNAIVSEVLHR